MSHENVEIVRRVIDHYNATGDFPWELVHPEILYVIDPPAWLAGSYCGHPEVKDLLRRTWDVYDEFRFEIDEFIEAPDAVVGLGAAHVRGALSGATAVQPGAAVCRVRDGRVVALRIFLNREDALDSVGLRE
jgi:ketosteroid isomerase-like protein